MTPIKLDGEPVAARIKGELAVRVAALARAGVVAGLGTVLVGDDASSAMYVEMKREECAALGIASHHLHFPATASEDEIADGVTEMNARRDVHSILVQLPLPDHVNEERILRCVDPDKDVDGLHPVNLGRLVMGKPGPLPCTPHGIVELLASYDVPVEGRHVVIIGRGITIGRPLALLMALKRPGCNAAVTAVHTGVSDLGAITRTADVIVAAAGRAGLLTADMVKPGAAVVGAGTTFEGRKLLSDVASDVKDVAGWLTPRLGGVGPMTRAMLLFNAVGAAERSR